MKPNDRNRLAVPECTVARTTDRFRQAATAARIEFVIG